MGRPPNLVLGHLIQEGKQSSTVKSYISAMKATLQMVGVQLDNNTYLLHALACACKLKNDTVTTRLPISKSMLEVLLRRLRMKFDEQPYLLTLYTAMLITAYYGLFRIGEIMSSQHTIKACDVHIATNKKKMLFVLRSSKTHGPGSKPQTVKITASGTSDQYAKKGHKILKTCPFQALHSYLQCRKGFKSVQERFFIFSDRSPVSPRQFEDVFKTLLKEAGFDHEIYSVHGLRSGRALDLLHMDVPIDMIKKIGCWKSNAIFTYLKYHKQCYYSPSLNFVANLIARDDIWFLGDDFLKSTYPAYRKMHVLDKSDGRQGAYVINYYNIDCHTMGLNNGIKSVIARMYNGLVNQLNVCKRLPRFIIFIPDHDIVRSSSIFFDFGARILCQTAINWLLIEANKAIEICKEGMKKICKGSVKTSEPKIIIAHLLHRPHQSDSQAIQRIFNEAIQAKAAAMHNVIDMDLAIDHKYFDQHNQITPTGEFRFWCTFDRKLELIDKHKVDNTQWVL